MTRQRKLVYAAGVGGVVVALAGLGAAGAVAASSLFSPRDEAQAVIDDAAAQLGVEPSRLSDALEQALENRLDEALESGRLTEEQAERLRQRLESEGVPLHYGFAGARGQGPGHPLHAVRLGILDTAATFLGMSPDALREALRDSTLADVARERGRPVAGLVDALVATHAERIDEAVDDGRLTDEQATALKRRLDHRVEALVEGELRRLRGGGRSFGHRAGSPRGPSAFGGRRA